MKRFVSIILMIVTISAAFAYEPTTENAVICKYDILPEGCDSYETIMECMEDKQVLVAPNFNETTDKYVVGFYINLEYFRDMFKSFFRHAMTGKDDILYDLANDNIIIAVEHIPFVTYENFWTLTYDEMFDMYCEYSIQMFR